MTFYIMTKGRTHEKQNRAKQTNKKKNRKGESEVHYIHACFFEVKKISTLLLLLKLKTACFYDAGHKLASIRWTFTPESVCFLITNNQLKMDFGNQQLLVDRQTNLLFITDTPSSLCTAIE